jgi:hypothetical protein
MFLVAFVFFVFTGNSLTFFFAKQHNLLLKIQLSTIRIFWNTLQSTKFHNSLIEQRWIIHLD